MLNKDVFKKEVAKLVVEYGSRGFDMSTEKVAQWYERFSELSNYEFAYCITLVLDNCTYPPSMADIVKHIKESKNYYAGIHLQQVKQEQDRINSMRERVWSPELECLVEKSN